jgi:hypothetical protein
MFSHQNPVHVYFIKSNHLLPIKHNRLFSFLYINTATCFGRLYSANNRVLSLCSTVFSVKCKAKITTHQNETAFTLLEEE